MNHDRYSDEYLRRVTGIIGAEISREEWVRIRSEATQPRPAALAAVRRAAELGRVALLTNNGILIHEHLHEVAPELVPIMGRNTLPALEIAKKYAGERSRDDRELDFVLFLDAVPQRNAARFATEDEFCQTIHRPRGFNE